MSDLFFEMKKNNAVQTMERRGEMQARLDLITDARPVDSMLYDNFRTYRFINKNQNSVNDSFNRNVEINARAGAAIQDSRQQSVNNRRLSKKEKDVVKQEKALLLAQTEVVNTRKARAIDNGRGIQLNLDAKAEYRYITEKLKLIELQKKADLESARDPISKAEVKVNAATAKVEALREHADLLPVGHKSREGILGMIEEAEVEAHNLKWDLKILKLPEGAEKDHEKKQRLHKKVEGVLSSVIGRETKYCKEDTVLKITINNQQLELVNRGRAFMGGSKPSYIYEDPKTKKRYLFKKAENCCGFDKPEGAIMTSVGSWLQSELDRDHAILAEMVVENGVIVGSIQEIIDVKKDGNPVDLNKWQIDTTEAIKNGVNPTNLINQMTEDMLAQILRSHTVDWLLCNYDTKGENLLRRSDDQLVSIDKEGSCSHLSDKKCTNMDENYTPHTDEPIYNLIFRLYRDGRLNLDVNVIKTMVDKVERMDTEVFLSKFRPMLAKKFKSEKSRRAMEEKLRIRKENIRQEYANFFRNKLNKPGDANRIGNRA